MTNYLTNYRLLNAGLSATAALFLLSTPVARGASLVFTANLSGAAESPPVASAGTGFTTVTYDSVAQTLRVVVTFSGLTGNTTVAHIHAPTAVAGEGNIGVATPTPTFPGFPAGVTLGSYDQTLDLTQASSFNPSFLTSNVDPTGAEAALVAALMEGKAYLNIHSSFAPGGEIRGFLAQRVPEPGMGLASALALLGLVVSKWYARRDLNP
jgi:hypothetical protein